MFHFKTIQTKTMALVFSVFLLAASIHAMHDFNKIKSDAFKTLDSVNDTVNAALVDYTSAYVFNQNIPDLQRTINAFESIYIKSISILDQDGMIIVTNVAGSPIGIKHPVLNTLLHTDNNSIKKSDEYLILNTFDILGVPIGYMLLEGNLETYKSQVDKEINTLLQNALLWLAAFLIISVLITKSLSHPIHDMIKKLQTTQDDEVLKFPSQSQKEFKYLASTIANTHRHSYCRAGRRE